MKITNRLMSLSLAAAALLAASSCKNSDIEFPDYETKTVYFANQSPVRTLVFGEDNDVDTKLDNQGKFQIGATFGGSYTGKKIKVNVEVDNSLLNNIYFDDAYSVPVKALPTDYYSMNSTTMDFGGGFFGYIDVTLNDKFFSDPLAAAKFDAKGSMDYSDGYYVIPLRMTSQTGADGILTGSYDTEAFQNAPDRTDANSWKVAPKDYVLFAVNYISKYCGYWLESGVDQINGKKHTRKDMKNEYEYDETKITYITTLGLNKVKMKTPGYTFDKTQPAEVCEIILDFKEDGTCTISAPEGAAYTVTGTGKYTQHGAGKYWGENVRDLITLEYTIVSGANTYQTTDQLVSVRRGIKFNAFSVNYKSAK